MSSLGCSNSHGFTFGGAFVSHLLWDASIRCFDCFTHQPKQILFAPMWFRRHNVVYVRLHVPHIFLPQKCKRKTTSYILLIMNKISAGNAMPVTAAVTRPTAGKPVPAQKQQRSKVGRSPVAMQVPPAYSSGHCGGKTQHVCKCFCSNLRKEKIT